MKSLKLIYSSALAAIVSIIFSTGITVWADLSAPLKESLKSVTGHHWVTKSWAVVFLYLLALVIFYFWPKEIKEGTVRKSLVWLTIFSVIGAVVLLSFYMQHYLQG